MGKRVDQLGKRMKESYESRFQTHLMCRTYTVIRVDGRAFHTYTKGLNTPYDKNFMEVMDRTAVNLAKSVPGTKIAFVQSDEISLIVTDFDNLDTQPWFDNNVQKIVSITASIASVSFTTMAKVLLPKVDRVAMFDSRVFQVPNQSEAMNYLLHRQRDCRRNSIQMLAQEYYSQNELNEVSTEKMIEKLKADGHPDWTQLSNYYKNGRTVVKCNNEWEVDSNLSVFSQNEWEYLKRIIPENL